MRLIGTCDTEKEAYTLYSFLLKERIQNVYEPFDDPDQHKKRYRIWVVEEDYFEPALEWFKKFQENPRAPEFQSVQIPLAALLPASESSSKQERDESVPFAPLPLRLRRKQLYVVLTQAVIAICIFLFLWSSVEDEEIDKEKGLLGLELTVPSVEQALLFDYPKAFQAIGEVIENYPTKNFKEVKELPPEALTALTEAEKIPSWKGLYAFIAAVRQQGWEAAKTVPLFEKIGQGEFWRLFTPCLLHRDFLHILFNMAWAWILGKQIEERVRRWKIVLMILVIGVISNLAQYLMSGPYFLGYSGVVVGLAGFIWMRQRVAPWEGYPLSKATALFLFLFVVAMFALELLTFSLQALSIINLSVSIANTAHIAGGLCGLALGRLSFFSRGKS